jgi:hypothetical protein
LDRITTALLHDFVAEENLQALEEEDAFERFANFCVMSQVYGETFNVEDVSVGGGEDTGLDGVAVVVNGSLVTTADEVEDLEAVNGYLDVEFVFVQAKRSPSFSAAEIATFTFGAVDFFSDSPKLPRNGFVQQAANLQAAVYNRSVAFRKGRPRCRLFYVTTGQWNEDPEPVARVAAAVADLESTGLFEDVVFTPIGADDLRSLYNQSKTKLTTEFLFERKIVLPEIDGVSQAYLGVLPLSEFRKIITDDHGNLRGNLFDDNVRAFQSYNEVNSQILETLTSQNRNQFPVLNNGVTIVAKQIRPTGDKLLIEDYQIVNGCQTSSVVFDALEAVGQAPVFVPLKVVATDDDAVLTAIVQATNSQTAVKSEELQALSDFQKGLEAYFSTFDPPHHLFYERRSRQYANANIEKTRVISLGTMIRTFASMFLDEPHRASRYYATLLRSIGSKIFADDHRYDPYYSAAFGYYKLEFLFRNRLLDSALKPARYHLLMTLRYNLSGADLPPMNSKAMEKYCAKINDILWDDLKAVAAFEAAGRTVIESNDGAVPTRDDVKTQTATTSLLGALGVPTYT